MNSTDLKRAKRSLRKEIVSLRDGMAEVDRAAASSAIERRALEAIVRVQARSAMAFWSFGSEVATNGIIEALAERGVVIALPRIADEALEPRVFLPGDAVTETTFGAREPVGGRVLDPQEIDVVIVPGVAFDRDGYRIGYGGGFYDRFLPRTRPDTHRLSVAFSVQLVDRVPRAAFDLPVDSIVTELETVRTLARATPGPQRSGVEGHET